MFKVWINGEYVGIIIGSDVEQLRKWSVKHKFSMVAISYEKA